jgi:hypothetical protein
LQQLETDLAAELSSLCDDSECLDPCSECTAEQCREAADTLARTYRQAVEQGPTWLGMRTNFTIPLTHVRAGGRCVDWQEQVYDKLKGALSGDGDCFSQMEAHHGDLAPVLYPGVHWAPSVADPDKQAFRRVHAFVVLCAGSARRWGERKYSKNRNESLNQCCVVLDPWESYGESTFWRPSDYERTIDAVTEEWVYQRQDQEYGAFVPPD